MSMYGSNSIGFFLASGYSLLASKLQGVAEKVTAANVRTDGLGDSWHEHTPTGMKESTLSQDGAFYDTETGNAHEALLAPASSATRVVCLSFEGNTIGKRFIGWAGAMTGAYEVLAQLGNLTKANATYAIAGARDEGVILQSLATKTADWNTESADSVDNGAQTTNGGIGFQQVTALSGFTGYVGKVRDSADDITYADLVTFANVTAAPAAEAVTVSGTVDRYLACDGNVTGAGSLTVFIGFARR